MATKKIITLNNAKTVSSYVSAMHGLANEHVRALYLNSHSHLIHDQVIFIGTVDAVLIHPREIFKPAIDCCASAVILVHNHPSGVVTPSIADIKTTKQITEAGKIIGIELLAHVIVGRGKFASVPTIYEYDEEPNADEFPTRRRSAVLPARAAPRRSASALLERGATGSLPRHRRARQNVRPSAASLLSQKNQRDIARRPTLALTR